VDRDFDLTLAGELASCFSRHTYLELIQLAQEQSLRHLREKGMESAGADHLKRLRAVFTARIEGALHDPGFRSPKRILDEIHEESLRKEWGRGMALDIGCGSGINMLALAPHIGLVLGVDVSYKNLILCKKLIEEQEIRNACLVAADAMHLPLPSGAVSLVYCIDVVEHVNPPRDLLEEAHRVLLGNGWMYLTTPNRYSVWREPHTGLWGIGFLPRRLQHPYAGLRRRVTFKGVRLHSHDAVMGLVRERFRTKVLVTLDYLPERGRSIRRVKKSYRWLGRKPGTHALLARLGPIHELLCRKEGQRPNGPSGSR
jgi:ubiquinone/menaquinone biosynthesis C-methylase UbiE